MSDDEKLEKSGPEIVLPDSEEFKIRLQKRLGDISAELKDLRAIYKYSAPEMFSRWNIEIMLLEKLLTDGRVDTWDLSREYAHKHGSITDNFGVICMRIDDECKAVA